MVELTIGSVDNNTGVSSFRIRTETEGGAWCPKEHVSREAHEYLQIDLGQLKIITMVETQGRFGNGQVRIIRILHFSAPQYVASLKTADIHHGIIIMPRVFDKHANLI